MHTGFLGTAPDGSPTHSFHEEPSGWCCANHVLALPLETDMVGTAVHEAGHLVADLLIGVHVIDVTLTLERAQLPCGLVSGISGATRIGRIAIGPADYLRMLAAGEQAHQRWLEDSGLSTPARAWAVERGARDDTAGAVEVLRKYRPGLEDAGYRQLFWQYRPDAKELLDAHWYRVLNVAESLARRGYLGGDEASDLADLPNPPESPLG